MPVTTRNATSRAPAKVRKVPKAPKAPKAQKLHSEKKENKVQKQKKPPKANKTKVAKTADREEAEKAKLIKFAYKEALQIFEEREKHPEQCDRSGALLPGEGDVFGGLELDRIPLEALGAGQDYLGGGVVDEEFFLERRDGTLERVADRDVFPPYFPSLLKAPEELYADAVFIKRHRWYPVAYSVIVPGLRTLTEAAVLTSLAKHPHPHIARFLGCRVRRGVITGLVLERLPYTLADACPALHAQLVTNKDRFFAQLRSAVAHLHALGLTHNDIKPHNVMLRADGQPVLIDFDSCMPMGSSATTPGTPGWCRPEQEAKYHACEQMYAVPENDLYGLRCLEARFELSGCGAYLALPECVTRSCPGGNDAGPRVARVEDLAEDDGEGCGQE